MFFQEPKIDYIMVFPASIIVTSGTAGYGVCEKVTGDSANDDIVTFCNIMQTPMSQEEYCSKQETPGMTELSKLADSSVNNSELAVKEITPAATAAPVRSAPHFNNDLFK